MRATRIVVLIGSALAMATSALAGDKSQSTLVNPVVLTDSSVPAWTNGTSKGRRRATTSARSRSQLSGITLPDSDGIAGSGDEVICTADASVSVAYSAPLNTTAVLRGEVSGGKVKIKVDLAAEGTGCTPSGGGGPGVAQYDGRITCYMPDPAYPPPPLPFASDPTQGVYPAGFGPRPASPMIATQGLNFAP